MIYIYYIILHYLKIYYIINIEKSNNGINLIVMKNFINISQI